MNKHYITINKDNKIIQCFSDAFKKPSKDDICVNEEGGRHFHLNPGIVDDNVRYNWKYENNKMILILENDKISQDEIDETEKENLIKSEMNLILRDQAIQRLKDSNKLDENGDLINKE